MELWKSMPTCELLQRIYASFFTLLFGQKPSLTPKFFFSPELPVLR